MGLRGDFTFNLAFLGGDTDIGKIPRRRKANDQGIFKRLYHHNKSQSTVDTLKKRQSVCLAFFISCFTLGDYKSP